MTRIHATGTHDAHYRAERATIMARISVASIDRDESIASATALHNHVVGVAQQLRQSGDATWHSADPVTTWAQKTYAKGSKSNVIIEHQTSSTVRIKLANLDIVSRIVTDLASAGAATNVTWSLTEKSRREHERSSRKAAVGAAREIAEDYASALGERIIRVVSISDGPTAQGAPSMRGMSSPAGSLEAAEVTIREITVSASVAGEFESA